MRCCESWQDWDDSVKASVLVMVCDFRDDMMSEYMYRKDWALNSFGTTSLMHRMTRSLHIWLLWPLVGLA